MYPLRAAPLAHRSLRRLSPGVKVLAAIGGEDSGSGSSGPEDAAAFARLVRNPQSIERFAAAAAAFVQSYGLDGLELNWPGLTEEQVRVCLYSEAQGRTVGVHVWCMCVCNT